MRQHLARTAVETLSPNVQKAANQAGEQRGRRIPYGPFKWIVAAKNLYSGVQFSAVEPRPSGKAHDTDVARCSQIRRDAQRGGKGAFHQPPVSGIRTFFIIRQVVSELFRAIRGNLRARAGCRGPSSAHDIVVRTECARPPSWPLTFCGSATTASNGRGPCSFLTSTA